MSYTRLNPKITTRRVQSPVINADLDVKHVIALPTVSGYTPVGILCVENQHPGAYTIGSYYIDGTNAIVWKHRLVSGPTTTYVHVTALYVQA